MVYRFTESFFRKRYMKYKTVWNLTLVSQRYVKVHKFVFSFVVEPKILFCLCWKNMNLKPQLNEVYLQRKCTKWRHKMDGIWPFAFISTPILLLFFEGLLCSSGPTPIQRGPTGCFVCDFIRILMTPGWFQTPLLEARIPPRMSLYSQIH